MLKKIFLILILSTTFLFNYTLAEITEEEKAQAERIENRADAERIINDATKTLEERAEASEIYYTNTEEYVNFQNAEEDLNNIERQITANGIQERSIDKKIDELEQEHFDAVALADANPDSQILREKAIQIGEELGEAETRQGSLKNELDELINSKNEAEQQLLYSADGVEVLSEANRIIQEEYINSEIAEANDMVDNAETPSEAQAAYQRLAELNEQQAELLQEQAEIAEAAGNMDDAELLREQAETFSTQAEENSTLASEFRDEACADSGNCIDKATYKIKINDISPGMRVDKGNTVEESVNFALGTVIQSLMMLLGSISLLIMTVGAGFIILHHGQDELLSKGKSIFMSGVYALVVALGSYYLVAIFRFIIYSGNGGGNI